MFSFLTFFLYLWVFLASCRINIDYFPIKLYNHLNVMAKIWLFALLDMNCIFKHHTHALNSLLFHPLTLRLYCSARTSCLSQKSCLTSLIPLYIKSSWQNRNIHYKGWCTLFLFCRYLLHISVWRSNVQSQSLRVMPQTKTWLLPSAFVESFRQLLLLWDSVERWADDDDI
jgi:hypothetical protein